MSKKVIVVILAGIWITLSEFLRNEIIFKNLWENHYVSMGLSFETLPINGFLWVVWSFLFAFLIMRFLEKFSFKETVVISWILGFLMMWITLFNLQVLPVILLFFAVPLSLLEIVIAGFIIKQGLKRK